MKSDVAFPFETTGWPVLLVESSGGISRANARAMKLFGPLLEGNSIQLAAIWSPENHSSVEQFLASWQRTPVPSATLKFRTQDGHTLAPRVFLSGFSQEAQRFLLLQLLPEQKVPTTPAPPPGTDVGLAHKQKLECALQLARTVALDFNNALTSILGHTSLVLSKMEANHPWRPSLLEVEKSAAKAAEIANDLGTFSRQEKETRSQATGNLNLLVQRTVEFFQQNAVGAPVDWKLQLERKLFAAKFDEAKMQQALMKIVENSLQAIRDQGRVSIQTRNVELREPAQDRNAALPAGAYVCVEINDNGVGIEPEMLPRVFEPFFTTKRAPHRGLGLAWVYGIVTNHGGGVAISSQPGHGTSVRIYLPAEKRIIQDDGIKAEDLRGSQTILMVDDEDLLLTMGQTILSAYGYRVLTANSGRKALDLLTAKNTKVDLVITDLVMPAMSGRELVEQVRRLDPAMRILCTSGYVWPAGQEQEAAFLKKPFTSQELLLKVKQSLNENIS